MKIAKIYGIDIKLRLSTLFIVGLVGFYAAIFYGSIVSGATLTDLILVGLINGLIILFSVLLHELTHSLVAQRYGLKVTEIEMYIFGGASKIEEEPKTPKSEFVISIVGPLSSLVIGFAFLAGLLLNPLSVSAMLYVTLFYSGITNISLGIFNMLPAYPMDGGRVLRAALWSRRQDIISATKTAARVGSFFAYGLIGFGLFYTFFIGLFSGFWFIIIGFFLNSQTKQAYLQTRNEMTLARLKAKDMMSLPKLEIPFDTTITDALRYYFIPYKKSYFPVIQGNMIVGIIDIDTIKTIPEYQRNRVIVGYIMERISHLPEIKENDTGKVVLKKMSEMKTGPHVVAVKEENQIVLGLIGEQDLVESIRFCELNPNQC
jgi:Zn-dependent protease/predicted transcriptional regulator